LCKSLLSLDEVERALAAAGEDGQAAAADGAIFDTCFIPAFH
jgi:hypothetical protein